MNVKNLKQMILLHNSNVEFKKIAGEQLILTYGTVKYMVQPGEDETYNLLVETNNLNNPKSKIRYKLIGNFRNMQEIVNTIKKRKIA